MHKGLRREAQASILLPDQIQNPGKKKKKNYKDLKFLKITYFLNIYMNSIKKNRLLCQKSSKLSFAIQNIIPKLTLENKGKTSLIY